MGARGTNLADAILFLQKGPVVGTTALKIKVGPIWPANFYGRCYKKFHGQRIEMHWREFIPSLMLVNEVAETREKLALQQSSSVEVSGTPNPPSIR